MNDPKTLALSLLEESPLLKNSHLKEVMPLAGDASTRKFFRVFLENSSIRSVILLCHKAGSMPALSGVSVTQEEAYVSLSSFFHQHSIPVPVLYSHLKTHNASIVEDIGELPLWNFVEGRTNKEIETIESLLGQNYISILFQKCISIIKNIQAIPQNPKQLAFQRYLSFENYRKEAQEFIDHYASTRGIKPSEIKVLAQIFDALCETLISFPKTLSHFDFNAHNIFVTKDADIRVLDFQDACLTSPARDIVSLLHDRGTDEALGKTTRKELFNLYCSELEVGDKFKLYYPITLLHWDFRVSGRYVNLCKKLNTDKYLKWLPSTLRRLGRTLKQHYKLISGMEDVLEIILRLSPEAKEGAEDF